MNTNVETFDGKIMYVGKIYSKGWFWCWFDDKNRGKIRMTGDIGNAQSE